LKVKVNGLWEDVSGVTTHEVVVSDTDPRLGVYKNAVLWFDSTSMAMKAWDASTNSWFVMDLDTRLALTGGTLTGNLTFNGTNLGVNFTGGAGIYAWTDKPLTLRQGTNNSQPKIINNDGSGGRDIIDTVNGDARYLRSAASTNIDVSWLNSFSGTCQYRYNPMVVTCMMENVGLPSDTAEPVRLKMHDYPSGVSAPWRVQRVDVSFVDASNGTWWNMGQVQFNTDGVWFQVWDNRRLGAAESFSCTCSWAR